MTQDSPPSKPRARRVKWGLVVGLGLLLLLVAGLYAWPQTPAGRGWLLARLDRAAQNAGYRLDYSASRGNPWTGVALEDVTVEGPGVNLSLGELELGYFLPSLVTGELPLRLRADGVRGSIDASALGLPAMAAGESALLPVRPTFEDITITDMTVHLENAPFTVPNMDLRGFSVEESPGGVEAAGTLATDQGSAEVNAHIQWDPMLVRADIERADLSLAQHWWGGARGGTASGTVTVRDGRVSAALELEDGVAQVAGLTLDDIAGEVLYIHPRIETSLTGRGLGGPLAADGSVDIAARKWQGEVTGRAELADAAAWLVEGRLPVDPALLQAGGRANVELDLSGWTEVTLQGRAEGAGRLLNQTLDDLQADFGYWTAEGTRVTAEALYGGAPLRFELSPLADGPGFTLSANGQDLPLFDGLRGDLQVRTEGRGETRTSATLAVGGALAGRGLELLVDTTLDSDGLQLFVSGQGEKGATFEGAAVMKDGRLEGRLGTVALRLPWLTAPADLTLIANGPIERLPLAFEVAADAPLYPTAAGTRLENDLRGRLEAVWTGGSLQDVAGALGALELSGELTPGAWDGTFRYTLGERPLRGRVAGSVSLQDGTLELRRGTLEGQARLRSSPLELPGLTLPALDAGLELSTGDTVTASLQDPEAGVSVTYQAGRLDLRTVETVVTAYDLPVRLDGSAAFEVAQPLDSLDLDLRAETDLGELRMSGQDGSVALALSTRPGLALGPLSLAAPVELIGDLDLAARTAQLGGRLGEVELNMHSGLAEPPEARLVLSSGQEQLEITASLPPTGPVLSARGGLPLAALAEPFGLDLAGTLDADLQVGAGSYQGRLALAGSAWGRPLEAVLTGAGQGVGLEAHAEVAGQTLQATGTLLPALQAQVLLGDLGRLNVAGDLSAPTVQGEGTLPAVERAGLTVAAQPWTLAADLPAGTAQLQVGASLLGAARTPAGWRLTGNLDQTFAYRGLDGRLDAEIRPDSDDPAGQVTGTLELQTPGGVAALDVSGDLETLAAGGVIPAGLLAAALGAPILDLRGEVAVDARLSLQDGPSYRLDAAWRDGAPLLQANLTGGVAGMELEAHAEGLDLAYSGSAFDLRAEGFDLGALTTRPVGELRLSGALGRDQAGGWAGTLELASPRLPEARLAVTGQGQALTLAGDWQRASVEASVAGTLLPRLDVAVGARALGGGLTLRGALTGAGEPRFAGSLTLAETATRGMIELRVPEQTFAVEAMLNDGLGLSVTGERGAAVFDAGAWSGALELPFDLAQASHALRLEPSGSLGQTTIRGAVTGATLQGQVSLSTAGVSADLQADLRPYFPAALDRAALSLSLAGGPGLSWQAELSGRGAWQTLPLALQATIDGNGLAYRGEGRFRYLDEEVGLRLAGSGGELRLDATLAGTDLEPLQALLPLPVSGTARGELSFDTGRTPRLEGALALDGSLSGRPLAIRAGFTPSGLELTADAFGAELGLESLEGDAFALAVRLEASELALDGRVDLADGVVVSGQGSLAGRPLTLGAGYTPSSGAGRWRADIGPTQVAGEFRPADGGLVLTSRASAPEAGPFGPLEAELRARVVGGQVEIETLTASAGGAALSLAGRAWPEPELNGTARLGPWIAGPLALGVSTADPGYIVALGDQGFNLTAAFSPGLAPLALDFSGEISLASPFPARVAGDLGWRPDTGFNGRAQLDAEMTPGYAADLSLVGRGPLSLEGTLDHGALTLAQLALELAPMPWREDSLSGLIALQAPLSRLDPTWPGEPLLLSGELVAAGSAGAPRVSGPLELSGALAATGELEAGPRSAAVRLSGEGLTLDASADAAGWRLAADADGLDLTRVLPQLADPALTTGLQIGQAWGEPLRLDVEALALRTERSLVTGEIGWQEGLRADLEVSADLADLRVAGARYRGTLTGGLELIAGGRSLSGALEAQDLGLQGAPWGLSGSTDLGGSLRAPRLELDLRGQGQAEGRLEALLLPAESTYALITDLNIGDFRSDAVLQLAPDDLSAGGSLAWRNYRLELRPGPTPRTLALRGDGSLAGWRVELDLPARSLSLDGSLASLSPQAAGEVGLAWSWAEGDAEGLRGGVEDVAVGPVELGDVDLGLVPGTGAGLRLSGDSLDATVDLAGGGSWRLERLDVPLSESLALAATGEGSLRTLELDGELLAELAAEPVRLPFELGFAAGAWRLQTDSELLGGRLQADLRHLPEQGWNGTVSARALSWQGLRLSADGSLSGPLLEPALAADLRADLGPARFAGSLSASREHAQLEGRLEAPALQQPLLVDGRLLPDLHIGLSTPDGDSLEVHESEDGRLDAAGRLELALGPLELNAVAADADAEELLGLELRLPLPGLAFETSLPRRELASWLRRELAHGLALYGTEATEGQLVVVAEGGLELAVQDLRWTTEAGTLAMEGGFESGAAWQGNLVGTWQGRQERADPVLPWLGDLDYLPFTLTLREDGLRFQAEGETLRLDGGLDPATLTGEAEARLDLPDGGARLALAYDPASGPTGSLDIESLPLARQPAADGETSQVTLDSQVELGPAGVSGRARLGSNGSSLELSGSAGWASLLQGELQRRYFPQAEAGREAELRVGNFDPALIPWVSRRLPHLDTSLSGVLQLSENALVGQLIDPDLRVLDTALPSRLEVSGPLNTLSLRATLGESRVDLKLGGGRLEGLIGLERFPLQLPAEALVGESGLDASVTGVVRLDLPLAAPASGVIRAATQRIRLERDGQVSEGNVALTYEAGELIVDQAEFDGTGRWSARGRLTRDRLDFRLSAEEANFTPLLTLIPRLAELGVGAQGSLNLSVQGTPEDPLVDLHSPGLELQLAGGRYRLEPLSLTLRDTLLKLSGELVGLSPVGGQLVLGGGGQLQLSPLRAEDLQLTFAGQAVIPPIGTVADISGAIRADPETGWRLESQGRLGEPFTLSGDLAPLDLRLLGSGLDLKLPSYFVASSTTDVDLRLRYPQDFLVSGGVTVRQAQLAPAVREAAEGDAAPGTRAAAPNTAGRSPLYERVLFEDVRITAPQQVRFQANFGSAELAADLTLRGSAAEPALDGEVRALRGTFAFSGRDFSIDQATAAFDPTRGVYPVLDIRASTRYEKSEVLPGASAQRIEFVEPKGSSTFQVLLSLGGEFEAEDGGPAQPNLMPELSSDALIQVTDETGAPVSGPRPLDDQELVSLLALGRLELAGALGDQGALAGSVAQSALDTAIDLFILSELQNALGEALGVDLLEIRTSSLSSLLGGGDFSVSLEFGGYLDETLFASYSIGRFNGPGEDFAFTNEFNLRYDLDPIVVNLTGGVNFLNETFMPVPEFGFSVDYEITPLFNLGANIDLSSLDQSFGIGLNIRW